MPTYTLRPDADHARFANRPYGQPTDWQALSDNSDGSAVILYAVGGSYVSVHMSGMGALAGNQRILQVRPIARVEPYNTGFGMDFQLWHNDGSGDHYLVWNGDAGGIRHVYGAWAQSTPDGQEWSVGRVNQLTVMGRSGGGGGTSARIFELYAEVDVRTQPTVGSVGPTGDNPGTTRTPTITWAFGDPDGIQGQYGYRVKLFTTAQGNPEVGGAVFDSGDRVGGGWSHTVTTSLPNGTYYAYVRVSKEFRGGHWWSGWAGSIFTITDAPIIPASVTPSNGSTVTTSKPTLGAVVGQSALSTPARIEWQIASNSAFTTGLSTILEPPGDARVSGSTTEPWPSALARLPQGVWYIRARSIDNSGQYSNYSAGTSFTISHAPAAANMTPTGDVTLNYSATGQLFDWDFTDPDPAGDVQTAYELEVTRNDTGAVVVAASKVTSPNTNATVVIPSAQKDAVLRWRIRVYDQDNVVGAWSNYQLFRVADAPAVNITVPPDGGITDNARPAFTWTTTLTGGRTQATHRVRVQRPGNALGSTYDSGVVSGAAGTALTHQPPSNILLNGVTYEVRVDVTDSVGLTNFDINTFIVQFDQPRPVPFTLDTAGFEAGGYVTLEWTDVTKDAQWLRYVVYRKKVGGAWEVAATFTNTASSYTFRDQVIGANSAYEWAVTQFATRFGVEVESPKPGENRTPSEGFQISTAGWTLNAAGGAASRITTDGAGGSTASVELTDNSATQITELKQQNVDDVPVAPTEVITISLDLKIITAGTVPQVRFIYSDGSTAATFNETDLPVNVWETRTHDITVPTGKSYGYVSVTPTDPAVLTAVGQVRVDNIKVYGKPDPRTVATDDYWLIDPDDYMNSVRLHHVTGDSFTEEFEETFLNVIGRGRKHEIGTRYGFAGTLNAQLFDLPGITAREQRLRLEVLRNERKGLYLRNPFGDIWQVSAGAIQISRRAGVGLREFADVTIPYTEIS